MKATMRIEEAMHYCGVSRRTIYYWIEHGNVMATPEKWGRGMRVHTDSLDKLKRRRQLRRHR